jgi:hypothetical protein
MSVALRCRNAEKNHAKPAKTRKHCQILCSLMVLQRSLSLPGVLTDVRYHYIQSLLPTVLSMHEKGAFFIKILTFRHHLLIVIVGRSQLLPLSLIH